MTKVEELATVLEAHVMPGRIGDAMDLATAIDELIKQRVAEIPLTREQQRAKLGLLG